MLIIYDKNSPAEPTAGLGRFDHALVYAEVSAEHTPLFWLAQKELKQYRNKQDGDEDVERASIALGAAREIDERNRISIR
jgi:hypothetical protein